MLRSCRDIGPSSFNLARFYLMSPVFNLFLMSLHSCCDITTLNVDVALLLRLCFDVMTLSCDVAKLTWNSAVMCDVATDVMAMSQHWCFLLYTLQPMSWRFCDIEVNVMTLPTQCRNIVHLMSRH